MELLRGLTTSFRTLSILPFPGKDAERYSSALFSFTLVGLTLGSILFALLYGLYRLFGAQWPGGMAIVIVIAGIVLTRGFHLDGLADFADGFWGGYSRERILAIMKDSFLGTFGVIALVVVLLAKWIALVRLVELSAFIWIVPAYVTSRTLMVELMVTLPYARETGTAGPFIQGAGQRHRWVSIVTALIVLYLIVGLAGVIVFLVAWGLVRVFGAWCFRKVGGITGDLLGACSELTETLVLFLGVCFALAEIHYF